MKNATFILLFLLLVIPAYYSCNKSKCLDSPRKYTNQQWISDLDSMYRFMKKTHPGLYWKTPEKEFDNLISRIKENVPYMTDNQIITQLSKLAAMVKDGHTVFIGNNLSDKYFPVRIESFSDGFFVTAVSEKNRELYGARVITIGSCSIEEAFEKTGSVTSSDNIYSQYYFTTRNLTMGTFLNGLGITSNTDSLKLEIAEKSGTVKTVFITCERYPFKDDHTHKWFWYDNAVPDSSYININRDRKINLPLRLRNFDKPYWYQYLEDYNAVYFCFNSCESSQEKPFPDFLKELWRAVEEKKPDKLIIDLRNNFGGTNDYLQLLIDGIIRHEEINRDGHLFVMTGPKTFSAAMHCATLIEKDSHPVFAGEPTGAPPNHYADPNFYLLPNSGLSLLVSSKYWQTSSPNDKREWIEPEIKFEMDSKDYFEGKDEALEYILKNSKN